jgi:hypothetical protein
MRQVYNLDELDQYISYDDLYHFIGDKESATKQQINEFRETHNLLAFAQDKIQSLAMPQEGFRLIKMLMSELVFKQINIANLETTLKETFGAILDDGIVFKNQEEYQRHLDQLAEWKAEDDAIMAKYSVANPE